MRVGAQCQETVLLEETGLAGQDDLVCDSLQFKLMRATRDDGGLEGRTGSLPPEETFVYLFVGSLNG